MNTLRRSRSWITLALAAITMMAAAPGFAFSCCCHIPKTQAKAVSHQTHSAAKTAGHPQPSCHAEVNPSDAARPKTAQPSVVRETAHAQQDSLSKSVPFLHGERDCMCEVSDNLPFAQVESQSLRTSFTPVSATLPVHAFALAIPSRKSLAFTPFATSPPSSPAVPSIPSRAPPTV